MIKEDRLQYQENSWRDNVLSPGISEIFLLKLSVTARKGCQFRPLCLFEYLVKLFCSVATSYQEPSLIPICPFCWHFMCLSGEDIYCFPSDLCAKNRALIPGFRCCFLQEHQTPQRQTLLLRPSRNWEACFQFHWGLCLRIRGLCQELYAWEAPSSGVLT